MASDPKERLAIWGCIAALLWIALIADFLTLPRGRLSQSQVAMMLRGMEITTAHGRPLPIRVWRTAQGLEVVRAWDDAALRDLATRATELDTCIFIDTRSSGFWAITSRRESAGVWGTPLAQNECDQILAMARALCDDPDMAASYQGKQFAKFYDASMFRFVGRSSTIAEAAVVTPVPMGQLHNTVALGLFLGALATSLSSVRSTQVVLNASRAQRQLARAICPSCGYSLIGLRSSAACPECGAPLGPIHSIDAQRSSGSASS